MNKLPEALDHFQRCLKIQEKTIGKDHVKYGICLFNIGNIFLRMGKRDSALNCYLESQEVILKGLGEDHPYYVKTQNEIKELMIQYP